MIYSYNAIRCSIILFVGISVCVNGNSGASITLIFLQYVTGILRLNLSTGMLIANYASVKGWIIVLNVTMVPVFDGNDKSIF